MSKSKIRRKYTADAVQLHRISHPASHPYKKGPHVRGNRASMQDALEDMDKIQRINHPAKDQHKWLIGGVGRPLGSAKPGLQHVQVHLREESWPRHLITFHICFWRKPTSTRINRAPLTLLSLTHTHKHAHTLDSTHSKEALSLYLSLLLLAR